MAEAVVDDRQEKFSGTKEVVESHRFDEKKLETYLAARIDGFQTPMEVCQFKGGQSNPTYKLITPNRNYVLRRKPPGKLLPSAHAVDREYRIIAALHPTGFPVAKPYLLCEDESIIGTIFYVMDCVDGRIYWGPMLPDQTPKQRTQIYDAMNETFARLHNMDWEKLGLQDYGKPGNYVGRQVSRWTKQYKASETELIPEMEKLIEWLPQHLPTDARDSIVHGDYRLDNMILHPTEPKVIAVLDWELCTIGDPMADFTYHLMQWQMPGGVSSGGSLLDADFKALGIPDKDAYTAMYCKRITRPIISSGLREFFRASSAAYGMEQRTVRMRPRTHPVCARSQNVHGNMPSAPVRRGKLRKQGYPTLKRATLRQTTLVVCKC
jgi:aminoglycoside phosphotransferase (APT) family kinase protein